MTEKFKILANYIKDISSETPNIETFLFVKDNISKYQLNIDIVSKALKNKLIEVNTTLKFEDKEPNEKKSYFEIIYSTIVKVQDEIKEKNMSEFEERFLHRQKEFTNLININKPEINRPIKFFLLPIILKKKFHFDKNEVVIINITAVHKHLWTTNSIWPIKDTYWKYITPIKPHQKDPRDVNNRPLLNWSFIVK